MPEKISNSDDLKGLKDNQVIGNLNIQNSTILFNGKGNILVVEPGVTIVNSSIVFNGENSIVYLSSNFHKYFLNISIVNESAIFIDKNNYFNGKINIVVSEAQNLIIGRDCLFSFGIWIRTSDAHTIYDIETSQRISKGKSILIGDHVWVGQDAFLLKGTKIGSGSIIGSMSLVASPKIESNSIYGGNPAKKIKSNVFFTGASSHNITKNDEVKFDTADSKNYVFEKVQTDLIDFNDIDESIKSLNTAMEKYNFILNRLVKEKLKNRFFIE